MKAEARILAITLYSGENELDQCIAALQSQTYRHWEHALIRDLPNVEAHQALYGMIMERASEFDLFIKLDADMVLERESVLAEIVRLFGSEPDLDHAVMSVSDWYSGLKIMGMHVYTRKVRWKRRNDKLFVDPAPSVPGYRKFFWSSPAPVARHSPDPSAREAYLFGVHRALKVVQRDRVRKDANQASFQLHLLDAVWKRYQTAGDARRAIALHGAAEVFEGKRIHLVSKVAYPEVLPLGDEDLDMTLTARWHAKFWRRRLRWVWWAWIVNRALWIPSKGLALLTRHLIAVSAR